MVPAGDGEWGERVNCHPTRTPSSLLLTHQQEAEYPLQDGEELEPGADVPLRGPGCCEQGVQGGLEAGAAACSEGHGTQPQTSTIWANAVSESWGAGPVQWYPWVSGLGCREVGWEG